jgi:hypothetical protein
MGKECRRKSRRRQSYEIDKGGEEAVYFEREAGRKEGRREGRKEGNDDRIDKRWKSNTGERMQGNKNIKRIQEIQKEINNAHQI